MASNKKITEFPDVEAKLQKPTKKSAFERQKAEAEAKRQREAAETAAVYEDFVKSFDRDDGRDNDSPGGKGLHDSRAPPSRFQNAQLALSGGAGKRHFGLPSAPSALKSGPGSLGPPPSSFGKKRTFDGFQSNNRRDRDEEKGILGYDNDDNAPSAISKAFDASDDESGPTAADRAEEKAISKPTLRLANLPPGTSPAVIQALMPPTLTVENVKILPPSGPSGTERKSTTAIVTLSKETPATEIDAAVSILQNRYLGFGFYLSLHRHLSSAAISSAALPGVMSSSSLSHPFGARRVVEMPASQTHQALGHGRAFAPPPSYGPTVGGQISRGGLLHVSIQPPRDIRKLRMIHMVVEAILEHGPEFEALLMSRPDVQRQERWSWLWDARSEGGVWYRWRLWEIITGSRSKRGQGKFIPLFEGSHAWKVPDQPLPFEYTTAVQEFVSDSEYNSSDDDELDDDLNRQADGSGINNDQEDMFLNPIEKFKLAHFLARLPTTLAKLRKGDIARITAFAITHASRGADEIVDMIISNIERPFAYTSANPDHKRERREKGQPDEGSREPSPTTDRDPPSDTLDMSASRLLGLYVVSDILSSASTSGIRHAWRYRQLFETALRRRKVFQTLGMMAEKMNWGRLRAEKWKRSVGLVLGLWEGWCVFPAETQEFLVDSFENPPPLKREEKVDEDQKKGRWKAMEATPAEAQDGAPPQSGFRPAAESAVESLVAITGGNQDQVMDSEVPLGADDTDGEEYSEYTDDEDIDLDALAEEDLDGDPVIDVQVVDDVDSDIDMDRESPRAVDTSSAGTRPELKSVGGFRMAATTVTPSRKRMRAVDMFADPDADDAR